MSAFGLLSAMARTLVRPNHPGQLVLFVTDRCNCRCPMCFNADNVFSGQRAPDLAIEKIILVAKSLYPLPQLLLSGGEPFLRTDIAEIVRLFHHHSGTVQVSIPTNATRPEHIRQSCEQILEECPGILLNINLSLDNIGEAHDKQRGYPGCYDKVMSTYHELDVLRNKYKNLTVNIITIITEGNVDNASEIVHGIRKAFSPNYHALGLLRNDPVERRDSALLQAMTDKLNVIDLEKESFARLPMFARLGASLSAVVKHRAIISREKKARCFHCLAGSRIIVITNEGRLMPCEPLWLEKDVRRSDDHNAYCMADLESYHYDVKRALRSVQAKDVRKFVASKQCWCTYACAIQNGILYSPPQYIFLVLELMKKIPR